MIFEYFNIHYIYRYSLQRTIPDFLTNYCNQFKKSFTNITLFLNEEHKKIDEKYEVNYTTKTIDNLILNDKNQFEVIEDFKTFLDKKDWYFKYSIPYKRD